MESVDVKLQAALSLLQHHSSTFPEITLLPEFHQVKQREVALLHTIMHGDSPDLARNLYINAVSELHDVIGTISESERTVLRNSRRKGVKSEPGNVG